MSVWQATGLLSVIVTLLIMTTLMAVLTGRQSLIPFLIVGAVVARLAQHFVSRCPECGKSALIEYLLGEETWFRRRVLFMYRVWPEKICSRCHLDLTNT